jgi:hypothetical protein
MWMKPSLRINTRKLRQRGYYRNYWINGRNYYGEFRLINIWWPSNDSMVAIPHRFTRRFNITYCWHLAQSSSAALQRNLEQSSTCIFFWPLWRYWWNLNSDFHGFCQISPPRPRKWFKGRYPTQSSKTCFCFWKYICVLHHLVLVRLTGDF